MANPAATSPTIRNGATAGWPRDGAGPDAPFIGILVAHHSTTHSMPQDNSTTNPATPPPSTQLDLDALRARLNEARAAAAFGPSPMHARGDLPPRHSGPPLQHAPLIVAPPCLVNDVGHIAFAHLRTPIHNPATLIHDAILAHAGNPSFSVAGCVTFESASVRDYLVSLGSLDFRGNQITLEPVELADRASPVFDQLIEVQAAEFPHELWHDAGIRWALSRLGDICSVDHYCLEGRDFTAVRALVMVDRRNRLPDSLPIQFPPSNDIKVVKITKLATILNPMGPSDPSPFSSDSDSDADDHHFNHDNNPRNAPTGNADELPRGPPPSPVLATTPPPPNNVGGSADLPLLVSSEDEGPAEKGIPVLNISSDSDSAPPSQRASPPMAAHACPIADSSSTTATITRPTPRLAAAVGGVHLPAPPLAVGGDDGVFNAPPPPSALQLSSAFCQYDSSTSSNFDSDATAFTFSAGASSPDSATHESVLRKLRHCAKRSADKTKSLRRSSRLAAKEPSVFTDMTTRAVRAKAARLNASDVAKALKDAIHHAQLDVPEAPPASAAALAEIASLCGAGGEAAASVAHADDSSDDGGADALP
ncbi:hypothetical protein CFC21_005299 [Triticum aestivum]|uniref:Uncharacterized protein n=2 Tax=Triticum aestivum TaxID=4565 RepID=A0A3B5YRP8_WHEAT|nr:uncharacterized protein LOC123077014 [Triticum aestivum]KAF6987677.1 hypothetical protein CFC21_005299 [Triticum aestivum]